MPQDHKKQHFVAQFYLGGFAVEGGKVFVYDKAADRVFPAGPIKLSFPAMRTFVSKERS
jgi:hypothetical protein